MFEDPFIQDILFSVNRPGPEVIRLFHAQFTYAHEFVVIINFWHFKMYCQDKAKKIISVFRVTGLKILGTVGIHIFF